MRKPTIDRAAIAHVAELASLSLSDAEATTLATELDAILAYVAELDSLDTSAVPPTAHVQLGRQVSVAASSAPGSATWRADEVLPGVTHEEALAQAPRSADGGFAVPVFVEGEK